MLPSNLPVVDDWTWPGRASRHIARQQSLPSKMSPLGFPSSSTCTRQAHVLFLRLSVPNACDAQLALQAA